jgi:hypothetical protein
MFRQVHIMEQAKPSDQGRPRPFVADWFEGVGALWRDGQEFLMPLTPAQVLAIAIQCSSVDPHLILGIAQRESGLDPATVRINQNGTRDFGLMQINETNFGMLRLTARTALDPCQSIRAGSDLITILSRYNTGSPTVGVTNRYASHVIATMDSVRGASVPPALPAAQHESDPRRFTLANQLSSFSGK